MVEVLVATVLIGIGMMALIQMQSSQTQEMRALNEKLALLELKSYLMSVMADGTVCNFELNDPTPRTFDSTASEIGTSSISVPKIRAFANPDAPIVVQAEEFLSNSYSIFITSITLTDFKSLGGNMYSAKWKILFDQDKLVRSIHPIELDAVLTADNSDPSQTNIKGCFIKGWAFNNPSCPGAMVPIAIVPRHIGADTYSQVWCRGPFGDEITVGGVNGGSCPVGSKVKSCEPTGYGKNWTWSKTADGCVSSEGPNNYGTPGCSCKCTPPIVDQFLQADGTWNSLPMGL